jgi:hypothetical protein
LGQNALFEALLPNFGRLVSGDPEWKIAIEMLSVGTVRQRLQMAQLLTTLLTSGQQRGPFMEDVIVHFLWVLPANMRRLWIEGMRSVLEPFESSKIGEALADIEKIDGWI